MNPVDEERLARDYAQRVYRFAYVRLGNRLDAEDVTQETFLRLVRSAPVFPDEQRARAWLFQVAANCANDLRRAPWRRHEVNVDELPDGETTPPEPNGVLDRVLGLPAKYREVIHLFYYERASVTEIAQMLRVSPSVVKTRLHRGRKLLKEQLKEGEWYV